MKKIKKTFLPIISLIAYVFPQIAQADIENPVISDALGGAADDSRLATSGSTFTTYFVSLWNSAISIGAILVLIYFLWGSIEWITSGGDKGKLENARNKITQAIIGLVLLVGSYVIIGFVSSTFFGSDFNILSPSLPNNI